ncbi:MAG: hypothetical protein M3367_03315 [Acidobacteriota bacterium]|nr:hypothetical protein [Acidobacteriota bacterium]
MNYTNQLMKLAQSQILATQLAFADGEVQGGRIWNAIEKAITELKENPSIEFDGTRLTFVSRFSGEQRIVTAFGCHETCPCGRGIAYHSALFAIVERYFQLADEQPAREENPLDMPYFSGSYRPQPPAERVGKIRIN